ncbi:hypothetical protein THRCLA_20238 [Thraustotheca clavata]|uniref:CHCH domain-containing protein n=1 Tax=Thraustotheca clavata TaxID=74557 RepID=A0A1W0A9P4_9STRA|nr:hypothetical protein THRCLA_20238 [Thraustotheca clavata]
MKKMTRRVASESNECQPEFLMFIGAMAKHNWDSSKCVREWRDAYNCVTANRNKGSAKRKSTLNYHVMRLAKGL